MFNLVFVIWLCELGLIVQCNPSNWMALNYITKRINFDFFSFLGILKSQLFTREKVNSSNGDYTTHRCLICPYTSIYLTNIKRHLLNHTGERPFKCNLCGKSFKEKRLLKIHFHNTHLWFVFISTIFFDVVLLQKRAAIIFIYFRYIF